MAGKTATLMLYFQAPSPVGFAALLSELRDSLMTRWKAPQEPNIANLFELTL